MTEQENLGVKDRILFRVLLAEMIERKIVKYNYMTINNKKTKVFWTD